MITFFGTEPMFGLPHASPFAMKGEILLQMAGVDYRTEKANLMKAPKGKMPWIDDDGVLIADTSFIQKHLEDKYQADFSGGYDARSLGYALGLMRMVEDHLYWIAMHIRWMDDENFFKGPIQFFEDAPTPVRPVIWRIVRRSVRKDLHSHGMGRHTRDEQIHLARIAIDALADALGDNDYILGNTLCGADASIYGQLANVECPYFKSPLIDTVRQHKNLMAYMARMHQHFFKDAA